MTHRHEKSGSGWGVDQHTIELIIKAVRDVVFLILGAGGFIHELLRSGNERAQILIMCAALMGLPLIIRGDEKRQEAKKSDTSE